MAIMDASFSLLMAQSYLAAIRCFGQANFLVMILITSRTGYVWFRSVSGNRDFESSGSVCESFLPDVLVSMSLMSFI